MTERTRTNLVVVSGWLIAAFVAAMLAAMYQSAAHAQSSGPVNTPLLNKAWYFVGTSPYATTIQSAVTAACASSPGGAIVIPAGVAPSDTIGAATGGCTKAWILDQRAVTEACYSWSGSAYTATACATGTLTPGGGNYAVQYDNGGALGGVNFTGLVWNNGTSNPPSQATVTNVGTLGKLTNATSGNADTATALSGALAANQVLGSLTATAPSGLNVPSCSGATNGLTWTTGTGYGCNTYSFSSGLTVGTTTISGGTSGSVEYNNTGVLAEHAVTGSGSEIVSSTTGTRTSSHLASWNTTGDAIDSGIAISNVALLGAGTQTFSGSATWNNPLTINSILFAQIAECDTCVVEPMGTATSSSGNFPSGNIDVDGSFWNGSAPTLDLWLISNVLGTGTSPTSTLTFQHGSGGSAGTSSVSFPALNATSIGAQTAGTGAFTSITTPVVKNTFATVTVNGSTAGQVGFNMPEQGVSYKVVVIFVSALSGTASWTFPTTFGATPSIVTTNQIPASAVTSLSASGITITGSGATGFLTLIGF